jgi:sugar phosphate isomerase/epimerase
MQRYAISSWICTSLPAERAIQELASVGFADVELSADASPLVKAWESDPVGTVQQLQLSGITVPSIHTPGAGRHLDDPDDETRRSAIAANVKYFSGMRQSEIREIVIHPTSPVDISTEQKRAACEQRARASLEVLAQQAITTDIRLAVENLGTDPGRPCATMASLLQMIDGLGEHVGICFDIGHAEMAGLDLVDELKTVLSASKLFSLHLHDVSQAGKDHFIPGEGRIDFDAFLSVLNADGFAGGRTLEIAPPEADVPGRLRQVAAVRDAWESR